MHYILVWAQFAKSMNRLDGAGGKIITSVGTMFWKHKNKISRGVTFQSPTKFTKNLKLIIMQFTNEPYGELPMYIY